MRIAPFRLAGREDESLYSVLARWIGYLGDPPTAHVVPAIFGTHLPIYDDLPVGMRRLAGGGWLDGTAGDAVLRMTAYPYYAAFADDERWEAGMAAMLGDGPWPHGELRSWRVEAMPPERPRLCPACLTEMLARHPDPWWRRVHQLPTVLVCPDHDEVLVEAPVARKRRRQRYVAAGAVVGEIDGRPLVEGTSSDALPLLSWLAAASRDLLVGGRGVDVRAVRSDYRRMLADAGVRIETRSELRIAAADVVWFWRPVLERRPDWMAALNSGEWLASALNGAQVPPLHHLLLRGFLERG